MAVLTISGIDEKLMSMLRTRATEHGRSAEAEARAILRSALAEPDAAGRLGTRIRNRFADFDDVDFIPPRSPETQRPVDFSG